MFKVGDIVRCIDYKCNESLKDVEEFLKANKRFVVTYIINEQHIRVHGIDLNYEHTLGLKISRFVLAKKDLTITEFLD